MGRNDPGADQPTVQIALSRRVERRSPVAVYEEYLPPKRRPDLVSDMLPWRAVIAPGVVLHKDRWQTVQRTYAVRGPDVMGLAREVQSSLILQANTVLKRLGGKWMLQSEAQRLRVTTWPAIA